MPVNVQCPGCRKVCQIADAQLGQASYCPYCRTMFTTRAPASRPAPAPATQQAVQRPAPVVAGGGDEELMFWDDAAVSAALSSTPTPPSAPTPPPTPAPQVHAPSSAAKGPSRPLPHVNTARLDIGAATSVGRVRQRNEDSYFLHHLGWSNRNQFNDVALAIVADGLGGHAGGDMASGMLINIVGNTLATTLTGALLGREANAATLAAAVDGALKTANNAIFNRAQSDSSLRGMASTASVAIIWNGQVQITHVGDTRVYLYQQGSLTQLTKDQTLVAKMVDMGHLTPQQALTHPARNEVAQAVGLHNVIDPVPYSARLTPGSWLIVACDGLHAHVDARNLENAIRMAIPSASYLANQLVDLANQGGGTDNCTVVAVRCY